MNGTNKTNSAGSTANGHKPFRVAIIGGAIGGLSTALFLHHFCADSGISIDVYEQASEYKEIGAGVGIGINAAKLLHVVGAGEEMNQISGHRNDVWFDFCRWDNGKIITTVSGPATGDQLIRPASMARSEFLDVLLRIIKERGAAKLHTKKKLQSVKDCGDHTQITFEDDATAEADLVIGSDGIHSQVRQQFTEGKALYSGKIAYRGVVPTDKLPMDTWPGSSYPVIWVAKNKHFLVFPISSNKSLNIVAFISKREDEIPDLRESWSSTCDRKELEDDFGDCEVTVQKVIQLMPKRPSKWRINDHEPVLQWTFLSGKVVLVGDACHAMVPHQGAGAGQAVEDGYILSRALSDYLSQKEKGSEGKSLKEWMELYQQVRLPRAQQVQQTSRDAGELYELRAPIFEGKTYDECLPILEENLKSRMKWVWFDNIDAAYDTFRSGLVG